MAEVSFHDGVNEHGTPVSIGTCTTCRRQFSVCPATTIEQFGSECLADDCASYDLARDVDTFFEPMAEAGLIGREGSDG